MLPSEPIGTTAWADAVISELKTMNAGVFGACIREAYDAVLAPPPDITAAQIRCPTSPALSAIDDRINAALDALTDGMIVANLFFDRHPLLHQTVARRCGGKPPELYTKDMHEAMLATRAGEEMADWIWGPAQEYDFEVELRLFVERERDAAYDWHVFTLVLSHPRLRRFVTLPVYKDRCSRMVHERFTHLIGTPQEVWFEETFGIAPAAKLAMDSHDIYERVWGEFSRGYTTEMKKILVCGPCLPTFIDSPHS